MQFAMDEGMEFKHVMLLASNSWLIRSGVEKYIRPHGNSMEPTKEFPALELVLKWWEGDLFDMDINVEKLPFRSKSLEARDKMYGDMYTKFNAVEKGLIDVLSPEGVKSLVYMGKHEGSFYPGSWMVSLCEELAQMPGVLEGMSSIEQYLEEIIFPTWGQMKLKEQMKLKQCKLCSTPGHNAIAIMGDSQANKELTKMDIEMALAMDGKSFFGVKPVPRAKKDKGIRKRFRELVREDALEKADQDDLDNLLDREEKEAGSLASLW
uniref:Uncharacterized protein n=2 Tax=Lotharella globosa TaxID=91324 RepID=A0A7S3ZF14_9EUKA